MTTHILLVHCEDRSGLIFTITGVIYRHSLNILSNGEFVEKQHNRFFMRTEFSGEVDGQQLLHELTEVLPADAALKLSANNKKNIVLLATKEYHCVSDLLIRHKFNDLHANILAVVSNYDLLGDLVTKFDVPFFWVDHNNKTREEHEQEVLHLLQRLQPELLVLAKYMRVLTPGFINHYNNRIVNIHHSFLPAFVGANPYLQAYERGVKIIGATAHFVNNQLDEGPIIAQNVIPVDHTHSAREMAQAGRDVEKNVLAYSLNLVLQERVFVYNNKTIILN